LSADASNPKDAAGKLIDIPVAKNADILIWVRGHPTKDNDHWKRNATLDELEIGIRATLVLSPDENGQLVISRIIAVTAQKKG